MTSLKRGLRLQKGHAPLLDEWYPLIADVFAERFWLILSDYTSPLFRLWNEDESLYDDLLVRSFKHDMGDCFLFRPESMTRYLSYHHHCWWKMYGVPEEAVSKLHCKITEAEMDAFLMQEADPVLLNPDGTWWEIFTDKIDLIHQRLSPTRSIALSDILLTERRLLTYGTED